MKTNARLRPALETLENRTLMSTCHVTRLSDTGGGFGFRGDLRYCINKVNDNPGPDAIDFKVKMTGAINLKSALPNLASDIDLQGPGANVLIVRRDTGGSYRIFTVPAGVTVEISGLRIADGHAWENEGGLGGGILNNGTLTIRESWIYNNTAATTSTGRGGGIYNTGSLTIINSTISSNVVDSSYDTYGAGIYNSGNLAVYGCTISGNVAAWFGNGSGVYNGGGGVMTIRNSTIYSNWTDVGSAIQASGAVNDISHSTIHANQGYGGYPGGGISGPAHMWNTIVAGNADWDVKGQLGSSQYNLIGDSSDGSGFGTTDILDVDPLLGLHSNNGGPTSTHALLPGSPAIDAGTNHGAPEWDQRGPGFPRIVNGTIDIGAFEVQATGMPQVMDDWAVLITADWAWNDDAGH